MGAEQHPWPASRPEGESRFRLATSSEYHSASQEVRPPLIPACYEWFAQHQAELGSHGFDLDVGPSAYDPGQSEFYARVFSESCEWFVQVWESGHIDSHFADWTNLDAGVAVTTDEIESVEDLCVALDVWRRKVCGCDLNGAMGPAAPEPEGITRNLATPSSG